MEYARFLAEGQAPQENNLLPMRRPPGFRHIRSDASGPANLPW